MRKSILFIIVLLFSSCQNFVDKPKDLLPQDKMAQVLAEMALNDQASYIDSNANLELGTRFILKKHNIKANQFSSSYRYYVVTKKILKIIEKAQAIIKEKNPEGEEFINKKLKENSSLPPLSR